MYQDLVYLSRKLQYHGARIFVTRRPSTRRDGRFEKGDVAVFQSHKYHNVLPVTKGQRKVLICELWEGSVPRPLVRILSAHCSQSQQHYDALKHSPDCSSCYPRGTSVLAPSVRLRWRSDGGFVVSDTLGHIAGADARLLHCHPNLQAREAMPTSMLDHVGVQPYARQVALQ